MKLISNSKMQMAAGILASAALSALYVRGGLACWLGFVLLVPWLLGLNACRTLGTTLMSAYAMSLAYTAAVFPWVGMAIGRYTQIGEAAGLAVLLLGAPLFQPQFLALALVRHMSGRRYGPVLRVLAAAAAWVAAEHLVPRLLGDTLGYGLYPSPLLRQAADLGGSAGLTLLLLLSNEGIAAAFAQRAEGWRRFARPFALAALVPLLLAGYGLAVSAGTPAPAGKPLRMGLVQANMVDYEHKRQQMGTYAVVRAILNQHFAMSYDVVERQHADAVLWSETAYPTTFGHPKSAAGAGFDREILDNVKAARVPFVFGTYDIDGAGEYNAAAFVQPASGLQGFYRKTRLFPLTEYVPAWLDGPALRRLLPWTGNWLPGNGARVFPLRLADGREIPVQPLICLDDVDTGLALAGARLGAQAILTMSNDSWFTAYPQGARLHQTVAAFRSIETRLPQFRVTTNGYSAAFDANGNILAATPLGEPALVIADVTVRQPAPTLMVRWGDWVGVAACAFLLLLAAQAALRAWSPAHAPGTAPAALEWPARVAVLPPAARLIAGLLRSWARLGLLGICVALLLDVSLRTNTLAQIRYFAGLFLAPEAAAWFVLRAFAAQATIAEGRLVLSRGTMRLELALGEIAAIAPWRLPLPCSGAALWLTSGQRWGYGLALAHPAAFTAALNSAGVPSAPVQKHSPMEVYAQARLALRRWRIDHPLIKFLLLPLALAIPAFHLHQHIAYGSAFGEYYTFGMQAYLSAFALWWAAWSIGVVLCAALLRSVIEAAALMVALLHPRQAVRMRLGLEQAGHAALYLGLPAWLLFNLSS